MIRLLLSSYFMYVYYIIGRRADMGILDPPQKWEHDHILSKDFRIWSKRTSSPVVEVNVQNQMVAITGLLRSYNWLKINQLPGYRGTNPLNNSLDSGRHHA